MCVAVVADDVQLLGVGTAHYCRRTAPVVAKQLIQAMECAASLPVSGPKLVVMSTHPEIEDCIIEGYPSAKEGGEELSPEPRH